MPVHNLTRTEAVERAAIIEATSYEVHFHLEPEPDDFRVVTRVRFTATPGADSFIDAITASVSSVELNGNALDVAQVVSPARIALPGLAEANELVIDARFHYMNTGEGLHKFVDPVDNETYLYTQFEVADARRAFPVFEQPDIKAPFAFTVTAPAAWAVVSNSPTPSPADEADGFATWRFAPTPPISSYITALVAGPYQSVHSTLLSSDGEEVPLGIYARRSLFEHVDAEEIFDITRAGFEFFEKNFGQPYPFEKYDQLFVPEFSAGAMENAGAVTIVENYVFRSRPADATVERRAITILHELAHMWFGDLVTMTWWNDLWLNESFAEYMSTLAAAEATRWTGAWTTFLAMEKGWAYDQDQLPSTHPVVADIRDLEDVETNFDGITYAKGASVLKQLVAWVGQDEFLAGVRAYFEKHAWSNTELADLLSELETTSGRDLSGWAKVWLEESGVTTLAAEIEAGADGTIAALTIRQAPVALPGQPVPSLRPHRLRLGFYNADASGALVRTEVIELDVEGEATAVPAATGKARPDVLLVNDDDLAYAKISLDSASLRNARAKLSDFADPLPQLLVWAAVWDMTRDAALPARDYVQLVCDHVASIPDSTGLMVQLQQLSLTARAYVAPAARTEVNERIGARLAELALAAAPGSDHQLQLVKAAARHARTPAQLDFVQALLSGDQVLAGLEIDVDLRWGLLIALAAAGRAGETEIGRALEADPTASGQRAATTARAAVPTAPAKRAAWESVVDSAELTNAMVAATITGFRNDFNDDLLADFVDPYFSHVTRLWAERTQEIAQQLVIGLYPAATPTSVAQAEQWLEANPDAPAGLARLMSENLDAARRALRCQELDAKN